MSKARKRRRACAFARHMNRVCRLNAHSVSWASVRAMMTADGAPWYFIRQEQLRKIENKEE